MFHNHTGIRVFLLISSNQNFLFVGNNRHILEDISLLPHGLFHLSLHFRLPLVVLGGHFVMKFHFIYIPSKEQVSYRIDSCAHCGDLCLCTHSSLTTVVFFIKMNELG